jgi:hypothetical protein
VEGTVTAKGWYALGLVGTGRAGPLFNTGKTDRFSSRSAVQIPVEKLPEEICVGLRTTRTKS